MHLAVVVLTAILGVFSFRTQDFKNKVLVVLFCFSLLFFILEFYTVRVLHWENNIAIGHSWRIVKYILITTFYYSIIESRRFIAYMIVMVLTMIIISAITYSNPENWYKFNSLPMFVSGISFISYSVYTYYKIINNKEVPLLSYDLFWSNTAIFIFSTGTTFLYLLIEYIFDQARELMLLWSFHNFLATIRAVLISISFYLIWRHGKFRQSIKERTINA